MDADVERRAAELFHRRGVGLVGMGVGAGGHGMHHGQRVARDVARDIGHRVDRGRHEGSAPGAVARAGGEKRGAEKKYRDGMPLKYHALILLKGYLLTNRFYPPVHGGEFPRQAFK